MEAPPPTDWGYQDTHSISVWPNPGFEPHFVEASLGIAVIFMGNLIRDRWEKRLGS